jgi:hypothetical protein
MARIEYTIVLFESTQNAIRAERALLRAGFEVKLIPAPRQFSSNCGTAIRCAWCDGDAIRSALEDASVRFSALEQLTICQ